MLRNVVAYSLSVPWKNILNDVKEYFNLKKDIRRKKEYCSKAKLDLVSTFSERNISCIKVFRLPTINCENVENYLSCNEFERCKFFDDKVCKEKDCLWFNKNLVYHNAENELLTAIYKKRNFWNKKILKLR